MMRFASSLVRAAALAFLVLVVPVSALSLPATSAQADSWDSSCRSERHWLYSNDSYHGTICQIVGHDDLYMIYVGQGQRMRFEMQSEGGTAGSSKLEIWDCCSGAGTRLTHGASGNGGRVDFDFTAPYTGTFAIRAGSAGGVQLNEYWVKVTLK